MKTKVLATLLVLTILMLAVPAGVVEAKAKPQNIGFNFSGIWDESEFDPTTNTITIVNFLASANLTGKFKEKGESLYLSPLSGNITVDGEEYNIMVKQAKQSEPVYHSITGTPGGTYEFFACWVEVNIKGNKFIGTLKWEKFTIVGFEVAFSSLVFHGVVDGKRVDCSLAGLFPEIN